MAVGTTVAYLGDLRVAWTHLGSGATLVSDAPKDNHGKGEMFSPTDICATSLAACAVTIMGLYAETHQVDIVGMRAEIEKTMSSTPPRRIASIHITFIMPDKPYSDKEKQALARAVESCPVHFSLHPAVDQRFTFRWGQ